MFVSVRIVMFPKTTEGFWYREITNRTMHIQNGNIRSDLLRLKSFKSSKIRDFSKSSLLSMGHLNIGGALKHKIHELEILFDQEQFDILGISEANLLKDDVIITNNLNYNFISAFTYEESKTRLGVFIKKGLNYNINKDIVKGLDIPIVWIELTIRGVSIAIVHIYREHKKFTFFAHFYRF